MIKYKGVIFTEKQIEKINKLFVKERIATAREFISMLRLVDKEKFILDIEQIISDLEGDLNNE